MTFTTIMTGSDGFEYAAGVYNFRVCAWVSGVLELFLDLICMVKPRARSFRVQRG